jgi:phage-related protein
MKELFWLGNSYKRLKEFPPLARRQAGHDLDQVQNGRMPADWKVMQSVGPGVMEIRIHEPHEFRVIYVAKFSESVYVLHAFSKKTNKTPQKDIEIARAAYAKIKNKEG